MMDYEIFKEVVKESFLSYMPKSYQDMEVRVVPVDKVNRKLDGLSLLAQNEKNMISPTLYINDMYEKYSGTGDLQATLREAAEAMDGVWQRGSAWGRKNYSMRQRKTQGGFFRQQWSL